MTPQEEGMLNDLVRKVNGTALQEKDPEAEQFLRDTLGRNPDSLYILCQTVLVQNMALEQAQRQLQQSQQPQPARSTSFLGSLFGHRDEPQQAPPQQAQYQPVQYAQQYQQAPPPMSYQPAPSGQPSFLRSAATTAAGVAAGALAFEGVESLLHGGGGGFGGGFGGGGYGVEQPREEIINNYYGDSGQQGGGSGDYVPGPDEQPQGGFDDTSYDDDNLDSGGGDFGGGDDTNYI